MTERLDFLTPAEQMAFEAAMRILEGRRRLLILIVPETASDELAKRLTTWSNYILDTKLIPPIPVPATRQGDGLICPYCGIGIKARFPQDISIHKEDCEWRVAMKRWALAQVQIDKEERR